MENKENKFEMFFKKYWFKIAIFLLFFLLLLMFLFFVVIIEHSAYNYLLKIEFVVECLFKIVFICLVYYLFYYWVYSNNHNCKILEKYKKENNNNDKKYTVKRCFEDGIKGKDKNGQKIETGRKHIYLVKKSFRENERKIYHHIVDMYTFKKLGYPIPPKDDDDCFEISDGYEIGDEIKIYNIISDIKNILDI
ncbi:MAG: hypothetical protein ABIA02_02895, partial [Candidatus Falkowbacteria bacterium]